MQGLLGRTSNSLTKIKATKTFTRSSILRESKRAAAADSTLIKTVQFNITINANAQEESDRQNMFCLAALVLEEGATKDTTAIVSKDITDTILRTSDGSDQ